MSARRPLSLPEAAERRRRRSTTHGEPTPIIRRRPRAQARRCHWRWRLMAIVVALLVGFVFALALMGVDKIVGRI